MSALGASRPLGRVAAKVGLLNPQPTLSPADGNRSSCPKAAVTTGKASRLRRQHPQTGHPLRLYGIEEHIKRRDLSIADDDHIQACIVGRLAARPPIPTPAARHCGGSGPRRGGCKRSADGSRGDRQQICRGLRGRRICRVAHTARSLRYRGSQSLLGGAPHYPRRRLLEGCGEAVRGYGRA